jgi:hypothetical protein
LEKQHAEAIQKINADEAEKLTNLLNHLADERIAAEAKTSDDEFAVRREAAKKQFDADVKQITALHLEGTKGLAARLQAEAAFNANLEAIEHDRAKRIEEIRIEAQQKIDEATGRSGEADPAKIRQSYQKQLDLLAATIASTDTTPVEKAAAVKGQQLIEQLIPIEAAKARMGELEKTLNAATTSGDAIVTRTSALLTAHAITEREAREQIVTALTHERDVIAATLPLLVEQAKALPGNADAQSKVDEYRTKLIELNLTIAQTADGFFKIKEAGRDAATSAVANLLQQGAKLGAQSHVEINALRVEIGDAEKELRDLLAIPAEQRTAETNTRISTLRSEIEATTVSLNNAQSSITTWRDLFISALQSIADALVRVSSQMLATALIERLLGLAIGGAVDPTDAIIAQGVPGVQVIGGHDAGGLIEGREGRDVLIGRLSRREFVQPRPAVEYYGESFMRAIQLRLIPRERIALALDGLRGITLRPSRVSPQREFNEGGLVESAGADRFSQSRERDELHLFIHSNIEDQVISIIKKPRSRDVVLTHVGLNSRQLNR